MADDESSSIVAGDDSSSVMAGDDSAAIETGSFVARSWAGLAKREQGKSNNDNDNNKS